MFEYWMDVDLEQMPAVKTVNGRGFSADSGANLIGVRVWDDGEAVALSGSVKANIIRGDGVTIGANGSIQNTNEAYVILPEAAYAVPGKIGIYIRMEDDGQVITLSGAEGYVIQSVTGTTI